MNTDETLIYDSSDNIKAIPQKLYEELIKIYYFNNKYFNLVKEKYLLF